MEKDLFISLQEKVKIINNLNDDLTLAKLNLEDGPKFKNIKEVHDFDKRILNHEFDYLLDKEVNTSTSIIESFKHDLDSYFFYGYTIKNSNKFITYLSIKKSKKILDKLCGKENKSKNLAHLDFIDLKNSILENTLDDILKNLIIGADKTILALKKQVNELASEN